MDEGVRAKMERLYFACIGRIDKNQNLDMNATAKAASTMVLWWRVGQGIAGKPRIL